VVQNFTAFIKATQIKRDESDSQSLTKIYLFIYCNQKDSVINKSDFAYLKYF